MTTVKRHRTCHLKKPYGPLERPVLNSSGYAAEETGDACNTGLAVSQIKQWVRSASLRKVHDKHAHSVVEGVDSNLLNLWRPSAHSSIDAAAAVRRGGIVMERVDEVRFAARSRIASMRDWNLPASFGWSWTRTLGTRGLLAGRPAARLPASSSSSSRKLS